MVYFGLFTCVFSNSICTVSIGPCVGTGLGREDAQEPSPPVPLHTQKCFPQPPRAARERWEQGHGPLRGGLGVLGNGRFHGDTPPCPSQALCNVAVGKAGLTAL